MVERLDPAPERIREMVREAIADLPSGQEASLAVESTPSRAGGSRELLERIERMGEPTHWSVIITDPLIDERRTDRHTVHGPYPDRGTATRAAEDLLAEVNRIIQDEPVWSVWATPCTAIVAPIYLVGLERRTA